ncbi:hypothetical protein D3C81_1078870 [compost metagenome]
MRRVHRAGLHALDDLVDLDDRLGGALCEVAHFIGDHGKTTPGLTGARRFDGRVQGQQVGLFGDAANHFQHFADAAAVGFQTTDHRGGIGDFAAHLGDRMDGALHDLFTLLGGLVGIVGRTRSISGVTCDFLRGGGHFVHRRGHLIGAIELFVGAAGHGRGDRIQLATGAIQIAGAALQTGEGFGEEIAQGVGGGGEVAQLILAVADHALGEFAATQLSDVIDEFADRFDQVAVDQPQAQQADQQARCEHHQQPQPHGAIGVSTDQRRLRGALFAQFGNQFTHLVAGGTVDTFDRAVARRRIATSRYVGIAALLVGSAEQTMFFTQTFDAVFQARLDAFLAGQFTEDVLHIALTILELTPIFGQIRRLLAAQQNVFPFLHLHLELQVGLVDQLRSVQGTGDQLAVTLHAVGEEMKTGQGNQQHRQQAAAQQGENLRSQGFLQHRKILRARMRHAR